ncbi:hypothetical protein WN51_01533 [Melipona quadrifasciata]|uniref:Uncharacterized protein n=1 Tax=Melipona quadrifasciata TaxID=166423 RepID=A0A0M8ZYW7_9HYME|nr:hypothetical protein WN51_01533 [Melipona quadrifasciata]
MIGIRFPHGFQQQSGFLDVVDITAVRWYHTLQVGKVTLGIYDSLSFDRVGDLIQFDVH